jgi:K+-sensing histidine kinase KdpD
VVAVLTFVCFRLRVNLTIASLLYLTVVVLLSVTDAVVGSIFVSVVAVLCLDYFFAPPLFSLRLADPLDIVALVVFLGTALLIGRLMAQRKRAEQALQKVLEELELKVQERTAELAKANDELRGEINDRQVAEEALQKAQAELAHVSRVMTLGELTASISHEVNQPIAAIVTNGQVCLRLLALEMPRPDDLRTAVERIVRDANRASEVIQRIRALAKRNEPQMDSLDINEVIREAIPLVQREVFNHGASLRAELASALPPVLGDRVQLQQVVINLLINGVEAMAPIMDRPRELLFDRGTKRAKCTWRCATLVSGLTPRPRNNCLARSSPPSRAAWGWDCRSAVRSSGRMVADCGYRQIRSTAQLFELPYRFTVRVYRERRRRDGLRDRR